MAIEYIKMSIIGRSLGRNAIDAAAYRSNSKLYCELTGQSFNYQGKGDCVYSNIMLPELSCDEELTAEQKLYRDGFSDQETLWNRVEDKENQHNRRASAQLAFELTIALPKELNLEQQIKLTQEFIKENYVDSRRLICDINIHHCKDNNPHAHIMGTMRSLESYSLNNRKDRVGSLNLKTSKYGNFHIQNGLNKSWSNFQNTFFKKNNIDLIVDENHIVPTKHQGYIGSSKTGTIKLNNDISIEETKQKVIANPDLLINEMLARHTVFSIRQMKSLVDKSLAGESTEYRKNFLDELSKNPKLINLGYGDDGRSRFTSKEKIDEEEKLIIDSSNLSGKHTFDVNLKSLDKLILKNGHTLNDHGDYREQAEVLKYIATSGDISLVVGKAGTGKTFTMKTVREMYEGQNIKVFGTALAQKAALGLENEAGIKSQNLYSMLNSIKTINLLANKADGDISKLSDLDKKKYYGIKKYLPSENSVLVVDEAGMIGTSDMLSLQTYTSMQNIKLVLVGDQNQLQPIDNGSPFRLMLERLGFAELQNIQRQKKELDRNASVNLSNGKIGLALNHYDDNNSIHFANDDIALDKTIEKWKDSLVENKSSLMMAFTHTDIDALNLKARTYLKDNKLLGREFAIDYKLFAIGERIVFKRNQKNLNITNGALGVVTGINYKTGIVSVKLDDSEKTITFDKHKYKHIDYGYATTIHKSQGASVDNAVAYVSGRGWDRYLSYVAFSRHKEKLDIVVNNDYFKNINELTRQLANAPLRDAVLDYPYSLAVRSGLDPSNLAIKLRDKIKDEKNIFTDSDYKKIKNVTAKKIKKSFNYIFNYEQFKSQEFQEQKIKQYHQLTRSTTNINNNVKQLEIRARLVANFVDSNDTLRDDFKKFKETYGSEWYKNNLAVKEYTNNKFADRFSHRNSIAYIFNKDLAKYEKALTLNHINVNYVKDWAKSYSDELEVKQFSQTKNIILKEKLVNKFSENMSDYGKYLSEKDLWSEMNKHSQNYVFKKKLKAIDFVEKKQINIKDQNKLMTEYLTASKQASNYWNKSQSEHFDKLSGMQTVIGMQGNKILKHHEKYYKLSVAFANKSEKLAAIIQTDIELYKNININLYDSLMKIRFVNEEARNRQYEQIARKSNRYNGRDLIKEYYKNDISESRKSELAYLLAKNIDKYKGVAFTEGLLWKSVWQDMKSHEKIEHLKTLNMNDSIFYNSTNEYVDQNNICYKLSTKIKNLESQDVLNTAKINNVKQIWYKELAIQNKLAYELNKSNPIILELHKNDTEKLEKICPKLKGDKYLAHIDRHANLLANESVVKEYNANGSVDIDVAYEMTENYPKHIEHINNMNLDKNLIWNQAGEKYYNIECKKLDNEKDKNRANFVRDYQRYCNDSKNLYSEVKALEDDNSTKNTSKELRNLKSQLYKTYESRNEYAYELQHDKELVKKLTYKFKEEQFDKHMASHKNKLEKNFKKNESTVDINKFEKPIRTTWHKDFHPEIITHQRAVTRREHPDYLSAKSGDKEAAYRLSTEMISDDSIKAISKIIGSNEVILVPVLAREKLGGNKIPLAFAKYLGKILNCEVSTDIGQANSPQRTGKNAEYRLKNQPTFSGLVKKNSLYIIVDDHSSMGATVANLKGYIETNGSKVIGAVTISAICARLTPDQKNYVKIKSASGREFSDLYVNNFVKEEIGYEVDYRKLTKPELGHIAKRITHERELYKFNKRNERSIDSNGSIRSVTRNEKATRKYNSIEEFNQQVVNTKTWNVELIQNLISSNPKILYDAMLGQPGIENNNIITYTPDGGVNFVEVNSDGYFRKYSKEPWGNDPNKKSYEKNSEWKTPWNYRSELFDHNKEFLNDGFLDYMLDTYDQKKYKSDYITTNKNNSKLSQSLLADIYLEKKVKTAQAQEIYKYSKSILNTAGEKYFNIHRGVSLNNNTQLRYIPPNTMPVQNNDGSKKYNKYGIVIVPIHDAKNTVVGVQRIYLGKDHNKASWMDNPKLSKGNIKGNAGVIQKGNDTKIIVAEGPETAASLAMAYPDTTVIASLSVGNIKELGQYIKEQKFTSVTIAGDNDGLDKNGNLKNTHHQTVDAKKELMKQGLIVNIESPKAIEGLKKTDWNDVLQVKGVTELKNKFYSNKIKEGVNVSKDNKMSDRDPYLYPGTDVLKNKFGIKDNTKLSKIEYNAYEKASVDKSIKGTFDLNHLQKIHKSLFGKVYDWAGEMRTVDISKGNTVFVTVEKIKPNLDKTFSKLQNEDWYSFDKEQFSDKAGKYFNDVNAVHPFREGNGRTTRMFFSALAKQNNLYIDWESMNKKDYIQASIDGISVFDAPMQSLINKHSQNLSIKNTSNQESIKNNEKYFYQRETKNNEKKNTQGRGQTF